MARKAKQTMLELHQKYGTFFLGQPRSQGTEPGNEVIFESTNRESRRVDSMPAGRGSQRMKTDQAESASARLLDADKSLEAVAWFTLMMEFILDMEHYKYS